MRLKLHLLKPRYPVLAGGLLVAGALAYDLIFAGLPYQDPTPAMQASWRLHKSIADAAMIAGLALLAAGSLLALATARGPRRGSGPRRPP